MRQKLFCDNWQFLKTDLHTDKSWVEAHTELFTPVCLPHDWLIYDTHNLYEDSIGWYRRSFDTKELCGGSTHYRPGERIYLRFDGVYMDSTLYINGIKAMEWKYGYSAFGMDITDFLQDGPNEILVKAVYQAPNSRWYSGAGIYRNVFIRVLPQTALAYDGTYVSMKEQGEDFLLDIETEICGQVSQGVQVSYLLCGKGGVPQILGTQDEIRSAQEPLKEDGQSGCRAVKKVLIKKPLRWDVEAPNLYHLQIRLFDENGNYLDEDTVTLGFRTMDFCPDTGFYLNGRRLKVHGVCEHHDFGCLGAAFYEAALRRKFKILRKMGVNAIRTSHNMPAKEFMDIAD
ncbi:MAG: glycoside hydrolase family 2 protein, partial [Lachnospiraceae bacterium]